MSTIAQLQEFAAARTFKPGYKVLVEERDGVLGIIIEGRLPNSQDPSETVTIRTQWPFEGLRLVPTTQHEFDLAVRRAVALHDEHEFYEWYADAATSEQVCDPHAADLVETTFCISDGVTWARGEQQ